MSEGTTLTFDTIVRQWLSNQRGTHKVMAALGELLTANAMFNLWFYQSLQGYLDTSAADIDRAGNRVGDIHETVGEAWARFKAADDTIEGSKIVIPILRSAAAELRGFLGQIDFYDDQQIDPVMRSDF